MRRFLDRDPLFEATWPFLEDYLSQDLPGKEKVVRWLENIRHGGPPARNYRMDAYLNIVLKNGQLEIVPSSPENEALVPDRAEMAVLLLWASEERRKLLRRCDECGKHFLSTRDHARDRSFCSTDCRTRFHIRERSSRAEYMRQYRKVRKKAGRKK